MDYDDASNNFAIASLVFDYPYISIPLLILAFVFVMKACEQKKECAERTCDTGHPMVVEGECVCVQNAE